MTQGNEDHRHRLRRLSDVSAGHWVEQGVGDFDSGVNALLPVGFEAYARVLHPVELADDRFMRWSEVAERSGRALHSQSRFEEIAGPKPEDEPQQGQFPAELLPVLCEVLAAHTSTAEQCYFGLWEGWGWIGALGDAVGEGPWLELSGRRYLLFEGPVGAATELGDSGDGYFFPQSPNLWWPQDRVWCVATDVDLHSTYVGGSARLVQDLAGEPHLEVLPAQLSDRLG